MDLFQFEKGETPFYTKEGNLKIHAIPQVERHP